jgi:hypothetical protein
VGRADEVAKEPRGNALHLGAEPEVEPQPALEPERAPKPEPELQPSSQPRDSMLSSLARRTGLESFGELDGDALHLKAAPGLHPQLELEPELALEPEPEPNHLPSAHATRVAALSVPLFDIVEEKEEENEERARPIQHDGAVKRFAEPPRSVPIPHCFFTNSSSSHACAGRSA